jgi:hypothetical protein
MTRADHQRAIIRTAAKAHWRHDRTRRALCCAVNDTALGSHQGQPPAGDLSLPAGGVAATPFHVPEIARA